MTTPTIRAPHRSVVFAFLVALTASSGVFADEHGHEGEFRGHDRGFVDHRGPDHGGFPHQHFDGRFSHNHYYFDRGYAVHDHPHTGFALDFRHDHYWYDRGQWYRRGGPGWVVVGAPLGAFVTVLPPFYSTVYFGGVPYYYADDTYYEWSGDHNEYEVVAPPAGVGSAGTAQPPATTQPAPNDGIFIYPKNGQSPEQQGRDRYECHRSAVQQTGYDPTQAGGGVPPGVAAAKRADYFRAETACFDARGYSVR